MALDRLTFHEDSGSQARNTVECSITRPVMIVLDGLMRFARLPPLNQRRFDVVFYLKNGIEDFEKRHRSTETRANHELIHWNRRWKGLLVSAA